VDEEDPNAWTKDLGERASFALPRFLGSAKQFVVAIVQVNGHPAFVETARDSSVIAVAVGEEKRIDVLETPPYRGERRLELVPVAGHGRINDGDAPRLLDEVPVDGRATEAVNSRQDLGRSSCAQSP
jgi:hypothetical protein